MTDYKYQTWRINTWTRELLYKPIQDSWLRLSVH